MYARRRRGYFAMMGTCVVLFVLAWSVVRIWSVPAAIGMCLVAMVIPPVAAIVANRRGPEDRWWDEQRDPPDQGDADPPRDSGRSRGSAKSEVHGGCGDPESDAWWAELDGRNRQNRRE